MLVLSTGILFPIKIQSKDTDSLLQLISKSEGIEKLRLLLETADAYSYLDPSKTIEYGNEALTLAQDLEQDTAVAAALRVVGFGYFYSYDFNTAVAYLKNSLDLYEKEGIENKTAKLKRNLGVVYMQSNDYEQSNYYLLKALAQYIDEENEQETAVCYNNLGLVQYFKSDYKKALEYFGKALEILKNNDNKGDHIRILNRMGMTYLALGINDRALENLLEVIKLNAGDNPKTDAIAYNNIGAIYKDIGEKEKALEYYHKAFDAYLALGDSLDLPSPLTNIGGIYAGMDQKEEALKYYYRALEISDKMGDYLQSGKTRHNMGIIFLEMGNFEESVICFSDYLRLCDSIGNTEGIAFAHLNLGSSYMKIGKNDESIRHLNIALELAEQIGSLQLIKSATSQLYQLYEQSGDYQKAFDYYKRYSTVSDSLYNIEKTKVIADIHTRYETEKKEQENVLLKKDNELKDKEINTLYFFIGGLVLITLFILLLIIQIRKNALNRKKLAESEAARLADKIEHQKRELASSALSMSRNLNFSEKLVDDLRKLSVHVDENGMTTLKHIIRNLEHLDTDASWKEFEVRFEEVHTDFYNELRKRYPDLSSNEVKLCAFLKLDMSTKEISAITYQSIRAIEAARLRLRKKLGLESGENLNNFLQQI